MKFCLLSFTVEVTAVPVDDYSVGSLPAKPLMMNLAVVRPLINGRALLPKFTFDAFEVLAQRTDAGPAFLFTCGCGEPGCAGIDDEVYIGMAGPLVTWTLPEEPFRELLGASWFEPDEELVLRFSQTQYAAALQQLADRLFTLEVAAGGSLAIAPDSCQPTELLATRLAARRAQKQEEVEQLAERLSTFGPLLTEDVVADVGNGVTVRIPAWTVPLTAADLAIPADIPEAQRHLEVQRYLTDTLLPPMLVDRKALLTSAKSIGLELLSTWMSLEFDERHEGVAYYPDVDSLLEPFQDADLKVVLR